MIIDCKSIAQDIKNKIKNIIAEADYAPVLLIYQVGDNPASNAYIRGKLRDCEEVGIEAELIKLPENITEDELNNKILEDYNWEDVDGIIVQLPLPKHINPKNIIIPDELDVDGFNSTSPFQPCTPLGVMKIFDSIGYNLDGKNVLVCGQSDIVGRPLVNMLIKRHCNVISINSSTEKYVRDEMLLRADVLITATGRMNLITENDLDYKWCAEINGYENSGSCPDLIIDVGINYKDGKQYGDCSDELRSEKYNHCFDITPRIGGVGLMTRAMLLYNVCVARYGEEKMEEVIE